MNWNRKKIFSFLKERPDRFKPEEANEMNLKRLEKIDFNGNMNIVENKLTKTNMILIKKGDLVISGINVEKGAVAVYTDEDDLLATIHYSSYEFDKNQISIEFFKWFLKSKNFHEVLLTQIKGGIKTELKPKKFLPLEILLPSIEDQKKILDNINKVNNQITDVISSVNSIEGFVDKLRQSILQEAVQGKLTADWRKQNPDVEPASELLKRIKIEKEKLFKEKKRKKQKTLTPITQDETLFELPEGWIWCRLGTLSASISDGVHYAPKYLGEGIPSISAKDIYKNIINFERCNYVSKEEYNSQKNKFMLKNGSILVTKSGSIGRTAIFDGTFKLYLVESVGVINLINECVLSNYIKILLDSIFTEITYSGEHVRGMGVKHLTLTLLKNILVSLPSLIEQNQIIKKVDRLMQFCDELEYNVKQAKEYSEQLMKAVLREAFNEE